MVGWFVRILLIGGGTIASCFVARDAPSFGVLQGVAAMLLLVLTLFVVAFGPERWLAWLTRSNVPTSSSR
jgi:hypothetical protein